MLEITNKNKNKTEFVYLKNLSIQSTKITELKLITTTPSFITTYFTKKYTTIQEKNKLLPGEELKSNFYNKTTKNLIKLFTKKPNSFLINLSSSPTTLTTTENSGIHFLY